MAARGQRFINFIQFRIVLPLVLLSAAFLRYNAISLVYLICLLTTPLLRVPSRGSMITSTGTFLRCLAPISGLAVLGHIVFHVTLVALAKSNEPYGSMFTNCSHSERIMRQIGYQRLDNASTANILRLVAPDVIVLITSIVTLVMSRRMFQRTGAMASSGATAPLLGSRKTSSGKQLMRVIVDFSQNTLLVAAGVVVPSVLGVVYFLIFLSLLTMWGCYKSMGRVFGFVRILLLVYTGSHIILLYLYQFQFFQEALEPSQLVARVLGLTGIVKTECDEIDSIIFYDDLRWSTYANVGLLLALYWVLAYNISIWRQRWKELSRDSQMTLADDRQVQHPRQSINEAAFNALGRLMVGGQSDHRVYGGPRPAKSSRRSRKSMDSTTAGTGVDPSVVEDVNNQPDASAKASFDGSHGLVKRKPWMSVIVLIMRQSYVLSLIAMMAWSITYHSWLTFVFLITACILWMLPNSRLACLRASPFVLLYAILLLMAEYVYNMDLKEELPTKAGSYKLAEVGLKRFLDPCLHLGLQSFYTLFLVLTMRQYLSESQQQATEAEQGIRMVPPSKAKVTFLDKLIPKDLQKTTYDSKTMVFIGHFLWILLCKYWIVVCTVMMMIIALQEVVIYKIIYMFFFLFFVLIFQLNYRLWRAINYAFWWVVIIYSMAVLLIIYTFQFDEFNKYWTSRIGISDKVLMDIGLIKYDTAGLFKNLLYPTGFLVIVILQVRYFHQPFLKLSDEDRFSGSKIDTNSGIASGDEGNPNNITEDEEEAAEAAAGSKRSGNRSWRNWVKCKLMAATYLWDELTIFLWRVGEIHSFKVVTLIIMITAIEDVSALTTIYVLLLAVFLPITPLRVVLSHLAMFWTTIIILAKMIYQLRLVETDVWQTNCTNFENNGTMNVTEQNNALWFGLDKVSDESISEYLKMYLLVLVMIIFESIIRYHQKQYYKMPSVEKPLKGVLFTNVTRADADKDVVYCCKFFANYFFYKFGLECCWVMTAITASIRGDAIALIYIAATMTLMMCSRRTVSSVWPIYRVVLAVMLAVQFIVILGLPRGACIIYPWMTNSDISQNLQQWLFLPDYGDNLHPNLLIADFLQLLCVCLQASVFSIESKPDVMINYGGGDNKDILEDVEANRPIPCEDFTITQKSAIEMLKFLIFEHMFWVTMAIIFITGATRINIFSLFYVIAVFCFMWFGKEFFLKPLRQLLRMWNLLTGFCVFVIFCKTALQLVGCVYVEALVDRGQCWVVQLFGVNCILYHVKNVANSLDQCPVEKDDGGMAWDVVCLVFLLIQRRIYSSHYFRHVVDTIQAQNGLVAKGAELINRIMIREVNKQNEMEKRVLVNIKEQMKALKKKQASLKKDFKEPEEHFQAIRAGDYYLFDDADSGKPSSPAKQVTTLDIGQDKPGPGEGPSPLQVINTAHDQGMETAIASYEDSGQVNSLKNRFKAGNMQIGKMMAGLKFDLSGGAPANPESEIVEDKPEEKKEEEEEPESVSNLRVMFEFVCTLWFSIIDGIISTCNRWSRNYRLVAKKLSLDLIQEKRKIVSSKLQSAQISNTSVTNDDQVLIQDVNVEIEAPEMNREYISLDELEQEDDLEMAAQFASKRDRLTRMIMAIGLLMASQSELLCYLLMILDQMVYGSLLSLPLPLMVFLWGMLSVPRPSKTFWVTVITYIEAIVVCKYLFQFGFFPWNGSLINESPFYPPRIIGIEKRANYANMDIALLLALFLHRSILRKYGLWKDSADITADMEAAQNTETKDVSFLEADTSKAEHDDLEREPATKMTQGLSYVLGPFSKFFKQVTESSYNATTDVYAPMFFCDFILFLVLVFGFSSFGPAATTGDGDVSTYIQDNKIPVPFLIMLLTQFIFIVIDRALFLRKNVLGKFIFQICLVIAIHIWMFFLLPSITERSFFDNPAAQLWYFIKSIYFGLSAYQIRCGYPTRILGNFLTKSYSFVNMILFKGFLAIPFLLELRALMDWMWTDSTLAIGNWLQMEDIYANIFVLKCWREFEKAFPQERSIKKSPLVKYLSGGALLVAIIFIIWFPLVFFSFFNAVFISNPPTEARLTIGIGGYQPLFSTTALGGSIRTITDTELNSIKSFYARDRNAYGFISGYSASDITLIQFDGNSLAIWGINPVSQAKLAKDLNDNNDRSNLLMTVEIKLTREPDKAMPAELSNIFQVDLRQPAYTAVRKKFAKVMNGHSNETIEVQKVFPRFLRLASQSKAMVLDQLVNSITYSNITMQLEASGGLNEWWNINELVNDNSVFKLKPTNDIKPSPNASFITFNDKKAPESLSFLSGYGLVKGGIVVMYVSFVLVVFKFVRGAFIDNKMLKVYIEEMPCVDYLLLLFDQIFMAREMKDYWVEEELVAKLIFIIRCPDIMFRISREHWSYGHKVDMSRRGTQGQAPSPTLIDGRNPMNSTLMHIVNQFHRKSWGKLGTRLKRD